MEPRPTDIGSRLRQAREQRGVTLRDIANTTKISIAALRAIERNDFDQLPGGIFTRAYIRTFAAEVGLSPEEMTSAYRAQFEIPSREEPLVARDVDREAPVSRMRLLAVPVFLGLLIYGSFWWRSAELPPAPPAMEAMSGAGEPDVTENVALTSGSAVPAEDEPALQEEPALQLEIQLRGVCWVSATADGQPFIYRLMQPGERALVEARDTIVLRVGDAGTFAYSINGAPGRPLGRPGQAVTVHITEDNYQDLLTRPPSATRGVRIVHPGQRARLAGGIDPSRPGLLRVDQTLTDREKRKLQAS